ncbi:MAG: glycosyltransferase family 39 protein [Bacteroidota bacterium]|nr:glycosyltransferase family 39 protein [Bacteroidota bacterium]
MKEFFQKNHRLVFYSLWFLLGLVQAGLTELQDDEAYYWVYSQYPDWGYFDHPPMIAVLVKMGYAIFPNELGVRFFPLLLNIFSLIIIEKLIDKKNPLLFYGIALSMAVIQVTGFVAVPDIPLIFFTALFFLCYKKFICNYSLFNTFLLGLSVALLLYSKYHAVLIIFFVLLSNIRLFTKYQLYIAGFIALLLFSPHLWWQYQHDWVSFRYHLFESNVNAYKASFTFDYIIGQLLLPGPIAGFILLPAAFLYKPNKQFGNYQLEKALRYTMIGIYVFFLLSSFRGGVESNWTSPVLVSLIVLAHSFLNEKLRWQKLLFKLLPITLVLVLFARVIMIADVLPVKAIQRRYHAWKEWPAIMKEKTKGLPVVFSNSYQRASKYWFYTGQMTYSQNLYKGRRNNYNFWPIEDSMLGKPVYLLDIYDLWRFPDSLKTPIGVIGYGFDSSLASFAKVQIETTKKEYSIKGKETGLSLHFNLAMPPGYVDFIAKMTQLKDTILVGVFNAKGWIKDISTTLSLKKIAEEKLGQVTIIPALPAGKYYLRFAIRSGYYYPTHNSDKIELTVD